MQELRRSSPHEVWLAVVVLKYKNVHIDQEQIMIYCFTAKDLSHFPMRIIFTLHSIAKSALFS
jgi:hypothetical protein